MEEYPSRLLVGSKNDRRSCVLQPGLLVLHFPPGTSEAAMARTLKRVGAEEPERRRASSLARNTVVAAIRREEGESLLAAARRILAAGGDPAVAGVAPVYVPEGAGLEAAISPIPRLLLRFHAAVSSKDGLAMAREAGLVHDSAFSKLLAPFHAFWVGLEAAQAATADQKATKRTKKPAVRPDFRGEPSQALDAWRRLERHPMVGDAEVDWLIHDAQMLVPDDTFWANQWNMTRIDMPAAWDEQTGGAGRTIAIIDSGIDLTHPDLQPALTPVATHYNAQQAAAASPPPYDASPDTTDGGAPHGTLCAGLAAASLNNAAGIAGVAGGCQLMPLRVFPGGYFSWVTAAVNWATTNGAHVISMSLGASVSNAALSTAIDNAWAAGIVLCAATGNYYSATEPASAPVNFPARHARCIAVGASDEADERKRPASADGEEWGSCYGPEIDVVAPGVRLWSTDIQGTGANTGWNNNAGGNINWQGVNYPSSGDATGDYFALMGGTSGATPQVAGLAALLMLRYPALTNQQVRDIIERTCEKVNAGLYPYANDAAHPNGTWHPHVGHGRINALRALTYADIMVSDHATDTGTVPSVELVGGSWVPAPFWAYQPYVTQVSNPTALPTDHEPAASGHDNYVHALVRNNGPATAFNITVTWHIMDYPHTALVHPADWNAANQIATTTIASLAAGAEIAVETLWPQALVDVAAGYVHPCMVVKVSCARDVGGDLGVHVWEYNNIAQHNISYGAFAHIDGQIQPALLPFAVGNRRSRGGRTRLLFQLPRQPGTRVLLDFDPDAKHPVVQRIRKAAARPQDDQDGCAVEFAQDTALVLNCDGRRSKAWIRAGSRFSLPRNGGDDGIGRDRLRCSGATWTRFGGRSVLAIDGDQPSVEFILAEGEMAALALIIVPPADAKAGSVFEAHVAQVTDGVLVGGIGLRLKA